MTLPLFASHGYCASAHIGPGRSGRHDCVGRWSRDLWPGAIGPHRDGTLGAAERGLRPLHRSGAVATLCGVRPTDHSGPRPRRNIMRKSRTVAGILLALAALALFVAG